MSTSKLVVVAGAVVSLSATLLWFLLKSKSKTTQKKHKLKLYYYPSFRSCRCIWLANELGISDDIDFIELNPQDQHKQKVELYKQNVHPHGTIPALVTDDQTVMLESGAICMYLADLYGKFLPNQQNKIHYYNWIVYACSTLDDVMEHLFVQCCLTEPINQDELLIARMKEKFVVFARHFSDHIKRKQYICGTSFTAADCVLGYNFWWASSILDGVLVNEHRHVVMYLSRLQKRAGYHLTFNSNKWTLS